MAQSQDVDTLKRRGRRRLVGAVALVLLAVIVLPMVFDPEPRAPAPAVSVRIPGEDDSSFAPKLAAKRAPAKKKEAAPPAAAEKKTEADAHPEQQAAQSKPGAAVAEAKPEARPAPTEAKTAQAERARAEAALADAQYIVPVGAFANASPVTAKLAAAKLPYYTEAVATVKGTVTRVRAGPFASRDAADQAVQKLKGLGFKPGNVAAKSG